MSVDEGADILSRLGILQSTLKSPHRKSRSRTRSMEDDSSSSDDCLFESDRISITRSRILRRQHRGDDEANVSNGGVSRTWILFTLFYLLFVFAFNTAAFTNDVVGQYGEGSLELCRFYIFFIPSFLLGTISAGSVYKRHDTLSVCTTLLSLTVAAALITDRSLSLLTFLGNAICVGVVQRGCILAVGLIKNPHRLIFSVCLTLALASLTGSLVKNRRVSYDDEIATVQPTNPSTMPHLVQKREIHGIDGSSASIDRVLASLPSDNLYRLNVSTADVRSSSESHSQKAVDSVTINTTSVLERPAAGLSTVETAISAASNSTIPLLQIQAVNQTANATLVELAVNGTATLTTVGPTSTTDISERVFKTKTEENKVMRQEAERKRREKEEALRKSAATTTTAEPTTTTTNTTIAHTTTSTTSTTEVPTTTTVPTVKTTVTTTTHAPITADLRWPPEAAADRLVTVRRGILNTLGNGDDAVSSSHPNGSTPALSSAASVIASNATVSSLSTGAGHAFVSSASSSDDWLWWPTGEGDSTAKRLVSWTIAVASTIFLAVHVYRRRFGLTAPTAALSKCSLEDELLRANDGTTHAESSASCVLSFAVWSLLFAIEETITKDIMLCSLNYRGLNELYQFLPIFWSVVAAVSVILIAWNKNAGAGRSVHFMYAIALATCLLFHRAVQMTYSISLIRFFLIGVVCSVGTWMVAAWLAALTRPDPFAFSARLTVAGVTGKAVATCLAHTSPKVHAFVFILLALSYALFVALGYTAQRADRQRQIIQLSDEINGRQRQRPASRKRRRRRAPAAKNGQYVALMNEEQDGTKLQLDDNSDEDDIDNVTNGRLQAGPIRYDATGDELSDDTEAVGQFRRV